MRQAIEQSDPSAEVSPVIIADGGDGTLEAAAAADRGFALRKGQAVDALRRPSVGSFGRRGDTAPCFQCGKDSRAAVVRGIGAQEDHPGRAGGPQAANGPEGVGDDPFRSLRRVRGALAQAGRDDHRGAAGSGGGRCCGVQSADTGVAERRTLLAMAVDLHDGVVEVDQCQVVDPGEQRRLRGERGEEP